MVVPVGTTAQRPAGSNGMVRYNSDSHVFEAFVNGTWTQLTTKEYVDAVAQGLSWKEAVRVKDTAGSDTSAYTYDPAADGAPQALAWTGVTAAPTWDGVTLADGDRILITEASDKRGNGIFTYDATAQGFRRAPDADNQPGAEIQGGSAVFVQEGTTYGDTGWVISDPPGSITLGVDQITWIQFTAAAALTASNGIIRVGNDFQLTGQASAIHNFNGIGYIVRNGPASFVARSINGTANQISVTNGDGTSGNTYIGIAADPVVPGSAAITVPTGTTADRPAAPSGGEVRFNTDNGHLEFSDGTNWYGLGANGDFVLRAGDTMLGALGIVPGSAAAPGLYFVGDTNTGLYQPAAGRFAIAADAITFLLADGAGDTLVLRTGAFPDRFHVDSTGNIGLGRVPSAGVGVDAGGFTSALWLPTGTTAQRPAGGGGQIRFNTDTNAFEGHDGTQWVPFTLATTAASRYVHTFNSTTDWAGPVGGYYTITVTAAVHGRGTDPIVQVFEGATPPYRHVEPDAIEVAANGDVTLYVSQTPDGRFAGKAVFV